MSNYPNSLDTTTNLPDNYVTGDPFPASVANAYSDGVIAIETKLGTGASTPATAGDVLTTTTSGASAWQTPPTASFTVSGRTKRREYNIMDYSAVADGNISAGTGTDNATAIQNAMNAATATGGILFFPPGVYRINTSIVPKSNVTVVGCGTASVLFSPTTNMTALFMSTQTVTTLTDFAIDNIMMVGPVTSTSSTPSRSRTRGSGAQTGVWITGSLDASTAPTTNPFGGTLTPAPATNPCALVQNISITRCIFRNFTWLPIRLFGVTGKTVWTGNESYNNMDAGFGFNESVICSHNRIQMSADNGISLSRGNTNVVCIGNDIDNCEYSGIFCSGYSGSLGPTNFTIDGNNITNTGQGGIAVMLGASYGTINNNNISRGYFVQNTGGSINGGTIGIAIQGNDGTFTAGTTSRGLTVNGNVIRGSALAGIYLLEAQDVVVEGNIILDPGVQFLYDGVTAIANNDTNQNIGILVDTLNATPCKNCIIRNNIIADERGTTYLNYGIYPQTPPSAVTYGNNTIVGAAQMPNISTIQDSIGAGTGVTSYPTETMTGPDATIGKVRIPKGNARLIDQTTNEGSITSIQQLHNTGGATTPIGTGVGSIVSAGSYSTFLGGQAWARTDTASNSNFYWRVLSNGALTSTDTGAAMYLEGTSLGPNLHVQANLITTAGRISARSAKTANYTPTTRDDLIAYTALAGARTVTLPTAVGCTGQIYTIKDEAGAAGTNNITIATTASQTIDGASTATINTNYGKLAFYSNGANWFTR